MSLLRRVQRDEPVERAFYDPSWNLPSTYNLALDIVDPASAADPFRPALTYVADDGTIDNRTFRELSGESLRWARVIAESGLEPGARVVIALEPGVVWAAAIVGASRVGVLPVLVGAGLDAEELTRRIDEVDAGLVVADRRTPWQEALAALERELPFVDVDDFQRQLVGAGWPTAPTRTPVESPFVLLYTRGRSGRPRPVVHAQAAAVAAAATAHDWLDARPGDVVWCNAPGSSATALWHGLVGPWLAGASVLVVDDDMRYGRIDVLERFAPTIAVQSPSRHERFLDELERDGRLLPSLRHAVSTDEPLDARLVDRFRERTGIELRNGYGTTETGTVVFQHVGATTTPGALGTAGEGLIVSPVDEQGFVAPDGVVGDLAVYGRPPSLCLGYWAGGLPEPDPDGDGAWTLTGDRAVFDERGQMWLAGAGSSDEPSVEAMLATEPAPEVVDQASVPDAPRKRATRSSRKR